MTAKCGSNDTFWVNWQGVGHMTRCGSNDRKAMVKKQVVGHMAKCGLHDKVWVKKTRCGSHVKVWVTLQGVGQMIARCG